MKEYRIDFDKVVYGFATIKAKNLKEARKKFFEGDFVDEFDNKSSYNYDQDEKGNPKFEVQ